MTAPKEEKENKKDINTNTDEIQIKSIVSFKKKRKKSKVTFSNKRLPITAQSLFHQLLHLGDLIHSHCFRLLTNNSFIFISRPYT